VHPVTAHLAGSFVPLEVFPITLAGILYWHRAMVLSWDGRPLPLWRQLCFGAGLLTIAVALFSPTGHIADELVIAHPTDDLSNAGALVALGGPALFLGGLMACAARLGQAQSRLRAFALVALLAAAPLVAGLDGLVVAALLAAVLLVLVVAEPRQAPTPRTRNPRQRASSPWPSSD